MTTLTYLALAFLGLCLTTAAGLFWLATEDQRFDRRERRRQQKALARALERAER